MRRQLRSDMSSHACAACQAKKAKCNGANPCDRCVLRKQPCHYTPKRRESKQSLRWEVDKLSRRQAAIDSVFALLRSEKHSSAVLDEIRRGEDVEDISVRCSDLHRSSLSDCPDDAESCLLASDSASPYTTRDISDPWLAPDATSKTWVLLVYMVYATGLAQLQEVERWTPDSDSDSVPTTARLGPGADPALAASLRAMRLLRVMDGGRGSEAENMRKILADELHVLMGPSAPVEN